MFSIYDDCRFAKVTKGLIDNCKPFSCGDPDMDDFFYSDALAYEKRFDGQNLLLGSQ